MKLRGHNYTHLILVLRFCPSFLPEENEGWSRLLDLPSAIRYTSLERFEIKLRITSSHALKASKKNITREERLTFSKKGVLSSSVIDLHSSPINLAWSRKLCKIRDQATIKYLIINVFKIMGRQYSIFRNDSVTRNVYFLCGEICRTVRHSHQLRSFSSSPLFAAGRREWRQGSISYCPSSFHYRRNLSVTSKIGGKPQSTGQAKGKAGRNSHSPRNEPFPDFSLRGYCTLLHYVKLGWD